MAKTAVFHVKRAAPVLVILGTCFVFGVLLWESAPELQPLVITLWALYGAEVLKKGK